MSIQGMNAYRKSVSGLNEHDNFGRRMSLLTASSLQSDTPGVVNNTTCVPKRKACLIDLLTNPKFHLFMIHGFFTHAAINMPIQFLPSQMVRVGLNQTSASNAISSLAIADLVGRLGSGFIMDCPKIGLVRTYIAAYVCAALCILCFQFCNVEGCPFTTSINQSSKSEF